MYVDIKETIWTRYYIRGVEQEEVLKKLKEGEYPWDISDDVETDIMFDTSEVMSVEENDEQSTMEFYNDNGETIWTNGK